MRPREAVCHGTMSCQKQDLPPIEGSPHHHAANHPAAKEAVVEIASKRGGQCFRLRAGQTLYPIVSGAAWAWKALLGLQGAVENGTSLFGEGGE